MRRPRDLLGRVYRWFGVAALCLLTACTALLPRSRSESPTFQTFDEARLAIESLVPRQSDVRQLTTLGLDPVKQPNIAILTRADIIRRAASGSVLSRSDLDAGILTCLDARDACRGWELNVASITRERTGNFWSDFFNFHRRTQTSGWRFNALILLVDDVVVYRAWGGQPVINEVEVNTNPLGPLQDLGPSVVTPR
jgi:hypothetical protein